MTVDGDGVRRAGSRVLVGPGTTVFRDVPTDLGTVNVRVEPDPQGESATTAGGDGSPPASSSALLRVRATSTTAHVEVEQRVGGRTVARADARVTLLACSPLPGRDRIDLDARDGRGEALVLVDGRRATGCVDDEPWTAEDIVYVGNLLDRRECHEEVVVFAPGDAVAVWTPRSRLGTDGEGPHREPSGATDGAEEPVPLPVSERPSVVRYGFGDHDAERLKLPLSGRRRSLAVVVHWHGAADVAARARDELTLADALLDDSRCGIEVLSHSVFLPVPHDLVATAEAAAGLARAGDCRTARESLATAGVLGDRAVHVFVSAEPTTTTTCREQGLVFVGRLAGPTSLAHALGHTLGLGHANGIDGPLDYDGDGDGDLGSYNLMWSAIGSRIGLRAGQCFRASFSPTSSLVRYAQPPGEVRDCSMTQRGARCPAVFAQPFGVSW